MLSRWPENDLPCREALTPREMAIKDDDTHPLRVLYVNAPSNWNAEPSPRELTAQYAVRSLVSLRLVGGTARKQNWVHRIFLEWLSVCPNERTAQHAMRQLATLRMKSSLGPSRLRDWLRRVFLSWVATSVGAQERRDRKIKKCVQRRREFFTDGKLSTGCRLHLERQPVRRTTISPSWDDSTTPRRSASAPRMRPHHPAYVSQHPPGMTPAGASAALPPSLHAKLVHRMHMMGSLS